MLCRVTGESIGAEAPPTVIPSLTLRCRAFVPRRWESLQEGRKPRSLVATTARSHRGRGFSPDRFSRRRGGVTVGGASAPIASREDGAESLWEGLQPRSLLAKTGRSHCGR